MTLPQKPADDFPPEDQDVTWGVEKNSGTAETSPLRHIIWVILTILIILSLIIPWIVPYFTLPRPIIDFDILANLVTVIQL